LYSVIIFISADTKRYEPGAVCIFYASILYHKVAHFKPTLQVLVRKDEGITPGRIGTVMFFPEASKNLLKGKEKGWGRKTNFGKNVLP
jgi:hypothetical protein